MLLQTAVVHVQPLIVDPLPVPEMVLLTSGKEPIRLLPTFHVMLAFNLKDLNKGHVLLTTHGVEKTHLVTVGDVM